MKIKHHLNPFTLLASWGLPIITWAIMLALCLASCGDAGGGRRAITAATEATATPTPAFSGQDNYLQNGTTTSTSYLYLPRTFSDNIYLRGKQIHYLIVNHALGENLCSGFYFPLLNTLLITAARPQSIYDYRAGAREYFYVLALADASGNVQLCREA